MVLGPLDRRMLKTRCQACAKRRIKCTGPPPCLYCKKKKLDCRPQARDIGTEIVFVSTKLNQISVNPSPGLSPKVEDIALARFFTVFISRNDFAGSHFDIDGIISSFQISSSLYDALAAIGSLDLRNSSSSLGERRAITAKALQSYQNSVTTLKYDMKCKDLRQSDSALWTTFFLGLFELMYDVTGEGWVKHILYGTSSILQYRGPEAHLTGRGRSFFLAIRIIEICRALIYAEPSFLSQPQWLSLTENLWHGQVEPHPKEELFDLMLSCSALGCKVWNVVKPEVVGSDELVLMALVNEGHDLRILLDNWQERSQNQVTTPCDDSWMLLAMIYYHATSILLSGIFDYRSQFDLLSPPSLPLETIQYHVISLLTNIEIALRTTNLAGILLFFPLRVAGARAWSEEQKLLILKMLRRIANQAFVVADAFVLDLSILWGLDRSREDVSRAWD